MNIYHIIFGCCENLLFEIKIDLDNNFVKEIVPVYYVPLISSFGDITNPDYNMSIGYIKVLKTDLNKLPKTIKIKNKDYTIFKEYADINCNLKQISNKIFNNYCLTLGNRLYLLNNIISENFSLNWSEKINLNYNGFNKAYEIFYFEQLFLTRKILGDI